MTNPVKSLSLAFILIVGILMVIAVGTAAWSDQPAHPVHTTNESLTEHPGSWQDTNASSSGALVHAYGNETVYANGTKLQEGTDYKWNSSEARIQFLNASAQSQSGRSASITYTWSSKPAVSGRWRSGYAAGFSALSVLVFLGVFVFVAGLVIWAVRHAVSSANKASSGRL